MTSKEALLDSLNSAQSEAVTANAKYLRVLAGAGSGKTRVLVHRIAWLMTQEKVPLHRILAVTFTNKAAKEMRERIENLMDIPTRELWVGTFHGLCHRILRQRFMAANLPENFQIIDADDQKRLIKRIIRTQGFEQEDLDKQAMGFINRNKEEARRHKDLGPANSPDFATLAEVYRLYEQHCERAGLVDFAEILLRVYEMLSNNPDILTYYRDRFTHILVDEFQDTNVLQYKWLTLLTGDDHLTIVGDDDQSIYGWRGAKIENIHKFSRDFDNVETVRLEQNYRSTGNILDAANALISNNDTRLGKALWTESDKGPLIKLYGAFNDLDEARVIIEQIKDWQALGRSLDDVAILYRSNAQSRVLEQGLRQMGLPYRIYGGLRYFDRAEIKDALAYLRLLGNTGDDPAFERIINLPPRGIGERTVAAIRAQASEKEQSLYEAAQDYAQALSSGRIKNGLNSFFVLMEQMQSKLAQVTLAEMVEQLLTDTGLLAHLQSKPGEKTQMRVENLQELVVATRQFETSIKQSEQDDDKRLGSGADVLPVFLSDVLLDAGDNGDNQEQEGVKLMTLHSAKGLEFPMVFLTGLEEGLFPHHRSAHTPELLEEERRLCYVGMTRAMEKLFLSYAEKRAFTGGTGRGRPSRFIEEIPAGLIEKIGSPHEVSMGGGSVGGFKPKSTPRHRVKGESWPFQVGQRVMHQRFGQGVVLDGEGSGEKLRLRVKFEQGSEKWLALAYAKLEAVE